MENTDQLEQTDIKDFIAENRALIDEAKAYLVSQGKTYPLDEWITLKEYTKRHNLSGINVIGNWIDRGNVPASDVLIIPEMNNIRTL